jgi:hypothetical protein
MPGVVSALCGLEARSRHDRATWYREHAEQIQRLAEMETRPRVRGRLLQLADEYTQLADAKSATVPSSVIREAAD